ncbi:hypothetical protein D1007_53195 [Hordeum vulgare]|nr:hypothetical protein D1007_53195 [Hordeum vulgare]
MNRFGRSLCLARTWLTKPVYSFLHQLFFSARALPPSSPKLVGRHHLRHAMVYEDESSNNLSSLDISSSSDVMMYRIPSSIDDEDYMVFDNSALDVYLEHGLSPQCRIAFEGFETGRRFLVCAQPVSSIFFSVRHA